jgi:hypothetical protein
MIPINLTNPAEISKFGTGHFQSILQYGDIVLKRT